MYEKFKEIELEGRKHTLLWQQEREMMEYEERQKHLNV